ncbi:MAG TPA: hypothetical protein VHZ51_20410 [Ktedonobacteraceae bacterium]|jgi:hypothetical protein|nr:hypothetical protein [Ktedonobacteraceae bacterium]
MAERSYATGEKEFQELLAQGFSEIEAVKLIDMRAHVNDQTEYREILEESRRLGFVRWLIDHDRLGS